MRDSTYKFITKRARASGIELFDLKLHAQNFDDAKWVIEVIYNGKDDELVFLGDTIYEVNIVDWIAENVCTEATIEGGIDSEPHWWAVRLYRPAEYKAKEGEALYELNEDNYGPILCNCGELVTGHDELCTECRARLHKMQREMGWEKA